jgi:hypothetical protein
MAPGKQQLQKVVEDWLASHVVNREQQLTVACIGITRRQVYIVLNNCEGVSLVLASIIVEI